MDATNHSHTAGRSLATDDASVRALHAVLRERREASTVGLSVAALVESIAARVQCQDEAIARVAGIVAAGLSGLRAHRRGPLASLAFFGPTGVGKTETARALSEVAGESPRPLIRLDMSEFTAPDASSRLTGANPGYIGFDDTGGLLTTRIAAAPNAVVLFDEFEKAHPSVHDTLLQILEEGSLSDGHGRQADFRAAIVIVTSNLGADEAVPRQVGFAESTPRATAVIEAAQRALRPELVGRFDALVAFRSLPPDALVSIAEQKIVAWMHQTAEFGWHLSVASDVAHFLVASADPRLGVRSIIRSIDEQLVFGLIGRRPGHYHADISDGAVRWRPDVVQPTNDTTALTNREES